MTTDEAREHREFCEAGILRLLRELTKVTRLDIARVEVFLIVQATGDGTPRREAVSARVELCV